MPLDPQVEAILAASAPVMEMDWGAMDAPTLRNVFAASTLPKIPVQLHGIDELSVDAGGRAIPVRLYRPGDDADQAVILYLHGGGWVLGSVEDYDTFCGHLAARSNCAVLSVGYRLAPEHPYPAAVDDCFAALTWLVEQAKRFGLDASRIAVMGDSAGGNLAAAIAYLAKQRGVPGPKHQILVYPAIDSTCDSESFRTNDRYFLTPQMMRWYWRQYIGNLKPDDTPYASPAQFRDLSGLPETTLITAEYDPLRDEGERYAQSLAQAGVPTELVRAPGMIHGFAVMLGMLDGADRWLDFIASRAARALSKN